MQIELKDLSFIIPIFTFFGGMLIQVVHFYHVDVLKDLNVSRSLNFHFD